MSRSIYLQTICDGSFSKPVHLGNFEACLEQGEAASDNCVPRKNNPYSANTGEYDSWDYGWMVSLTNLCGEK